MRSAAWTACLIPASGQAERVSDPVMRSAHRRATLTISSLTPVEEKYSSVKQLIELGKEKGYLLYDEIYEMLPEEVVSLPDELDEIYLRFSDLGVDVIDRPERYQNRDDFESGSTGDFDKKEDRSEEHTSELQSQSNLVCRLLLE